MNALANDPMPIEGRDQTIDEIGGNPIYIYLCTGEVMVVDQGLAIDLRPDTLKVFCPNCRDVTYPRKGIYMCAREKDLPPVPD
jgi:hypothetical protein